MNAHDQDSYHPGRAAERVVHGRSSKAIHQITRNDWKSRRPFRAASCGFVDRVYFSAACKSRIRAVIAEAETSIYTVPEGSLANAKSAH
jgi:hypothetical protein